MKKTPSSKPSNPGQSKLKEIDVLLIEYRFEQRFPGKTILLNGKAMLETILNMTNALLFFKHLHDHRDDLLDLGDDLEPIISFFNSEPKKDSQNCL